MEIRGGRGVACDNRHLPNRSIGNLVKIACVVGALILSAVGFALPGRSEAAMIDLGTLPGSGYSGARDVNDLGQVVGSSDHAFIWDGRMRDLGSLGGPGGFSEAWAINNLGNAVGSSSDPSEPRVAVTWNPPLYKPVSLGALPDQSYSLAYGVNEEDVIVGVGAYSAEWGNDRALVWTPDGAGGYVVQELPGAPPVGPYAFEAWDINDLGLIVGTGWTGSTTEGCRACVWEYPIGPSSGPEWLPRWSDPDYFYESGWAWGVSDSGLIVGKVYYYPYIDQNDITARACVWKQSGTTYDIELLPQLPGEVSSEAMDVNIGGLIVGEVMAPNFRACVWGPDTAGVYTSCLDIGDLGGAGASAQGVNIFGDVVGWSDTSLSQTRAFLYAEISPPEAKANELSQKIDAMVANGQIDESVAKALEAKVDVALEMIKKWSAPVTTMGTGGIIIEGGRKSGGTQPIVSVLTSFNTQVSAYVCSGKILPENGRLLTSMANAVIASLISPPMIPVVPGDPEVPAYYSLLGCGPTAGGMVIGYWDTLLGSECNLVYGSAAGGSPTDPGPYGNSQAVNEMMTDLASEMGTVSGQTDYRAIESGLEMFAASKLSTGTPNAQLYKGPALTWSIVKQEIVEDHPMVFFVDSNVDGVPDHFVTVIGYCELDNANLYAFYSTWDFGIWWASFDSNKKGNFFGVNAGVAFEI
jgi:probable HAF family extracellular repeat protein